MIENVQSPLCLKLLTISSPKNYFFIKPNRELELVREQSLTCTEQRALALQLYPLAGRAPPQHPRFSDLSFLVLLLGWLDSFSFNALLSSPPAIVITTMVLMPLYPSLACVRLPDSQIQRGTLQGPDQQQGNVSFFLWFGTLPCPFLSDSKYLN